MGCGSKIGNKMRWQSSGASFLSVWKRERPGGESKTRGGSVVRPDAAGHVVRPSRRPTYRRRAASPACCRRCPRPASARAVRAPSARRPSAPRGRSLPGTVRLRGGARARAAPAGVAPASHELLWSLDNESADLRAAPGQGGHALFGAPAPRKGHAGGRALETCVVLNDRTSRGLVTVVTVAQTCSPKTKSRPHRQF